MVNFLIVIGNIILWPWRMFKIMFQIPNCEINYKSGVRKRIFLKELNYNEAEISWTSASTKPIKMGMDDIESIFFKP